MSRSAPTTTVLHIGADKTGSTAIQRALADRRPELARLGVWYPDLDGRPDHRSLAVGAPSLPAVPADIDTVVLSSEAFWALPTDGIEGLLAAVPAGDLTVIGYLREPADHAEAAFAQRLRLSRSEAELRALFALRRVPAPINPIVARSRRRLRQLQRWVQVMDGRRSAVRGAGRRLLVRPYRPASGPAQAEAWDVVTDLCRAVGLERLVPLVADRPELRPNPTPSLTALHASVLVRRAAGQEAQFRFLDALASASGEAAGSGPVPPLLPPELRRRIRRRTAPALGGLDRAIGGLDAPFGQEIGPDGPSSAAEESGPRLDRDRARTLLAEVWPGFPDGGPSASDHT